MSSVICRFVFFCILIVKAKFRFDICTYRPFDKHIAFVLRSGRDNAARTRSSRAALTRSVISESNAVFEIRRYPRIAARYSSETALAFCVASPILSAPLYAWMVYAAVMVSEAVCPPAYAFALIVTASETVIAASYSVEACVGFEPSSV